jgi:pyruvate formate lyase activating enzyme
MVRDGVWVEVTTLLIPDENDGDEELQDIAHFLVETNPDIPWHISRFMPHYRMQDRPVTPVESIHRAVEIGFREGLHYVYAGNIPGDKYEHTRCPDCGEIAVLRRGYSTQVQMDGVNCLACGRPMAFVVKRQNGGHGSS